ncbi:MAG: helix-turn-helix transcriptional regulator [Opitutaceae bacterium]|nr:helix-turn-helix transcriptional regulator [Opitutaceae bacterium]
MSERTLKFRDWSCLRYHLVLAYDGPVPEETRRGSFRNEKEACWLVRRGGVKLYSGARSLTAGPGQWVLVGRSLRRQVFSDDAEILSLHFHLAWPGGEPVVRQEACRVIDAADEPALERAARPIVRRLQKVIPQAGLFLPDQPCSLERYFQVQNLLPVWLAAYLNAQERLGNFPCRPGVMDERVLQAVSELERQPLNEGFPDERLRRCVGVGKSQLNELFNRALGKTPRRYFDERRLEEARSLLRHTRRSVKQVAFALGFRHESHFSLWFRRHEGKPPSAWREDGCGKSARPV